MKKTVDIMDYRDRLFAADLFAGIVLEEDFDPGCNYTWDVAGEDWADKFRAELNGYINDGCCAERAADYRKALAILDEMEQTNAPATPDYTALADTMRDIKSQYPTIIQVSYCDAQNMLCMDDPAAYTAGVYGWNADIYPITSGVAICTGYRPFGNIKPDLETVSRYEKRALEMRRDLRNAEELAARLHNLQMEFVREVCNV